MGATKELFELGLKSIKTPIKNFIDNGLSKIDGKSLVHMYKTDVPRFEKLYSDMDNFTKTNDENAGVSIIKSVEYYTAQREQVAMAEKIQALTYKYDKFQIDESLPLEEQKRIYKKEASDYIYAAEQAEGKTVPVSKFFKEKVN